MRPQHYICTLLLLAATGPNPIGFAAARALLATQTLPNPNAFAAPLAIPATQTLPPHHRTLPGTHSASAEPLINLKTPADLLPDLVHLRDPQTLRNAATAAGFLQTLTNAATAVPLADPQTLTDAGSAVPALPAVEAPAASTESLSTPGLAFASIGSRASRALQQLPKLSCGYGCVMPSMQVGGTMRGQSARTMGPGPAPGPRAPGATPMYGKGEDPGLTVPWDRFVSPPPVAKKAPAVQSFG